MSGRSSLIRLDRERPLQKTVLGYLDTWTACQSDIRGYGLHSSPIWLPREMVGNESTAPQNACPDHSEVTPFAIRSLITEANVET